MDVIDKLLEKMVQECPLLEDEFFLKAFPGIDNVASFFYSMMQVPNNAPPFFKELGIETVNEYLRKVNEGNPKAVKVYETMKNTLGF